MHNLTYTFLCILDMTLLMQVPPLYLPIPKLVLLPKTRYYKCVWSTCTARKISCILLLLERAIHAVSTSAW